MDNVVDLKLIRLYQHEYEEVVGSNSATSTVLVYYRHLVRLETRSNWVCQENNGGELTFPYGLHKYSRDIPFLY